MTKALLHHALWIEMKGLILDATEAHMLIDNDMQVIQDEFFL